MLSWHVEAMSKVIFNSVFVKFNIIIVNTNWRASEASETLSGVTNGNRRYIYGTCKTL